MSHLSHPRSQPLLAGWADLPISKLLLAAVSVFLTAVAAIEFTRQTGRVAIIWPPDAIMLALLLRVPRGQWVPLLVAAFIGNWAADWIAADPAGIAFLLSACNTIELVLSITLFSRFAEMPTDLTRPATFFKFLVICGLLGPLSSALAASVTLATVTGADPWPVFYTWFAADSLGVFTILPIAAVLTGRNRLERETIAARRAAERANAAKSAFLTNMSHELRTPMTGIMGMCDLLLAGNQPPDQRAITETLERSTRSFLELLNDLLDLAKIEAGRMDLDTADFRISQVMRDVQEFFTPAMRQKGQTFTADFSTANTAFDVLIGDPKRLRQVLFNLVGNALKFTDHGNVAVRCRQGLQDDGTVLTEFEMRDTGIGMSREAQGRLFQPFEQEDSSTSRRFGGTGLGLNICKHIVEAMGGKIYVRSKQSQGSTFFSRSISCRALPRRSNIVTPSPRRAPAMS